MLEAEMVEGREAAEHIQPVRTELVAGVIVDGRYTLDAPLGGSQHVWACRTDGRSARVAVKLVPAGADYDAWLAEVQRYKRLTSKVLVRIFNAGAWGGWWYVVMPLLRGSPLSSRIGRSRPVALARAYLPKLLPGVAAMHHASVPHGQLAIENVVIHDGRPTLVGFGSVRADTSPATAPELRGGGAPTLVGDVWSLGALMHHVLASKPPEALPGSSEVRVADEVNRAWRKSKPVLERCLSADPDARYVDARSVSSAMRRMSISAITVAAIVVGFILIGMVLDVRDKIAHKRAAQHVADPIGMHVTRLSHVVTGRATSLAISPDGEELAYATSKQKLAIGRLATDDLSRVELGSFADGAKDIAVTRWLDPRTVEVIVSRDGEPDGALHVDREGHVTAAPGPAASASIDPIDLDRKLEQVALSPEGSRTAYITVPRNSDGSQRVDVRITVANPGGSDPRLVWSGPLDRGEVRAFGWLDNARLALVGTRDGTSKVRVISVDAPSEATSDANAATLDGTPQAAAVEHGTVVVATKLRVERIDGL